VELLDGEPAGFKLDLYGHRRWHFDHADGSEIASRGLIGHQDALGDILHDRGPVRAHLRTCARGQHELRTAEPHLDGGRLGARRSRRRLASGNLRLRPRTTED
jgi:hypothetical protein